MRVKLGPATEADICPLTLGPAAEDELEFLPGVSYLPGLPHIRLMTLPCKHSFGAMSLVYHFAQQGMRCPCCRSGVDTRIAAQSIPQHFRNAMLRRVESTEIQELRMQLESDAEAARALMRAENGDMAIVLIESPDTISVSGLDMMAATNRVDMSVNAHLAGDDTPNVSMYFQLVSRDDLTAANNNINNGTAHEINFEMPFSDHRRLVMQLEALAVPSISVAVHARTPGDRVVQLARTGLVPVRFPDDARDTPRTLHAGNSRLILHPLRGSDTLSHITWIAQPQAFEPLLEYYYYT